METIKAWYESLDGGQILGLVFTAQIALITLANIVVYLVLPIFENKK